MKSLFSLGLSVFLTTWAFSQLTPNGNTGSSTTSYTNGSSNDPIYIWCGTTLASNQASLTATPTNGVGPFTFNWFFHDQTTFSWQPYTTQTGATSTVNSLPSDGYRVEIKDVSNNLVDCYIAWVWNLNTQVVANNSVTSCSNTALQGTVNTTGAFTYYNPPPPQSIINPSTQIQVCFTATHTFVSDLAFWLKGPASCGSPSVLLSPNPGANGQGSICNSGDNVNNLCFSSTSVNNLNVCSPAPVSLSGTYGTYGPGNTPINWSALNGCNAAAGGWSVQIYDCISADVGSLTNATITFSNLSTSCGSPSTITYNSGAINSAINDNSCTAGTASIFSVPPNGSITTPITINASTALLWSAVPAVAITNSTSANASAVSPVGTTVYTLNATTTFGAVSCSSSATTSVTIALPNVDAGPNQSACGGTPVTLSGSGANAYTWDNGVTNGVAFTPASTMTYTVTGTDGNGCQNTDQVTVTVGPLPVIDAGSPQSVCPGTPVILNGSGGVSYTWNNGVVDGVAFTPASTTNYTVTGTDASGCQNTDVVTVTVHSLPAIDAGSPQSVCTGSQVTLNGANGVSYTWNNGVTNGVVFTPAATTTYTVTGTDGNGCQNTDNVTVTVNTLPSIDAGSPQSVCIGGQVTLNGSGGVSYTWNNGVTNGVAFTPASTTTYTVTGTSAQGCQNTDQVTVTVNSLPTISAGSNQTVCLGTPVTLNGSGGVSYTWNNGVVNSQAFQPGLGTNQYTVTGTDANGCVNTSSVAVTVLAVPVAAVSSTDPLSGYPSLTIDFTNGSQFGTTYSIDFDNGLSDNSTSVSDIFTSTFAIPGTYTVVLTASNGVCDDDASIDVIVIPYEPVEIYVPNVFTPNGDGSNDYFYVNATNVVSMEVIIENRWGNKMAEINTLDGKWSGDGASEGTYFFQYTIVGKDASTTKGQGMVQLVR